MARKTSNNFKIPTHVALIMDGNRRWAAQNGLGPIDGHRFAAEKTIKPVVERAIELGIPYLTFWAFSSENRKRDRSELQGLFTIFRDALKTNLRELEKMGVRVRIVGDIDWFPKDIAQLAKDIVEKTKDNERITVSFALNYGGREELLGAVNKLLKKIESGERSPQEPMQEEEFSSLLETAGMPDPDLVIRTGGEKRLSGYFPWQTVYSELYFTDTLWPDFSAEEFEKALEDYSRRDRRLGAGKFEDYTRRKLVEVGSAK